MDGAHRTRAGRAGHDVVLIRSPRRGGPQRLRRGPQGVHVCLLPPSPPSPSPFLAHILTLNDDDDDSCRPSLVAIQWSRLFVTMADSIRPAWFRRFLLDLVPIKSIQRMKAICDVINERSLAIYNEKKAAIERGDQELLLAMGEGKDMLSILRASCFTGESRQEDVDNVGDSEGKHEGC